MRFSINNLLSVSLIILIVFVSCSTQKLDSPPSDQVLQKCLEYSHYTTPGKFEYLYDNLPKDMEDICDLIKMQLVHPFDIEKFGEVIPKQRVYEDRAIPTVEQMLKELHARSSNDLVLSRKPKDRLVVACVHHSLLLAQILRHQGIPVRLRAGNAKYIGGDNKIRVTHVICEVWDNQRKVWFLVDPDRHKIDFDRQEFEFASETWQSLRKKNIERKFYISRYKSVDQASAHLLWLDLSYVMRTEEPYWNDPPLVNKVENSIDNLSSSELQLFDKIAMLLEKPDHHFGELIAVKENISSLKYNGE
ncbi:MAG: transglutaminase domain-containing protein [Candidatus Aminicenantes bacterium]|nr:transglutaminase domain-containing protein [Candidatus Aminicenantes bacterium]